MDVSKGEKPRPEDLRDAGLRKGRTPRRTIKEETLPITTTNTSQAMIRSTGLSLIRSDQVGGATAGDELLSTTSRFSRVCPSRLLRSSVALPETILCLKLLNVLASALERE